MDSLEKAALMAELPYTECCINHGGYLPESLQAVDYVVIPIGCDENNVSSVITRELVIPICGECSETLHSNDPNWVLFICINCSSSQWKLRRLLRTEYSDDIMQFMKYCPHCYSDNN